MASVPLAAGHPLDRSAYCHSSVRQRLTRLAALLFCASQIALPATAATILETGGSDFVAINVDPSLLHDGQNWKSSAIFRTPACQYDQLKTAADHELAQMRASGQKKIGTTLWFMHLNKAEPCSGFLLNSAGGVPAKEVVANLNHLLETAASLGFDEAQLRFAPMDGNRSKEWGSWKEDVYKENWSFISSIISQLSSTHPGIRIVYDLSAGLGGLHGPRCAQCQTYAKRIWSDYLKRFSPRDSYGFSINIAPGRVRQALIDMRDAGGFPSELGITTYKPAKPGMRVAAEEMRQLGVNLPILIQETDYDDPAMYRSLVDQARAYRVRIRAIMQWPVTESAGAAITETTMPAYNYLPAD